MLTDTVASKLVYDEKTNRVSGVQIIDAETGQENEFRSKIVFLCAATLGSTWLLLHSANSQFPNGLANGSGALGKYLMDHQEGVGATAEFPAFNDRYFFGGKPNGGIYMPRFRNVQAQDSNFLRGYGFRGGASRASSMRGVTSPGVGIDFKNKLSHPGSWKMLLIGFGEMLPDERNQVSLNHSLLDKHGLPTLDIHCRFGENERKMREDIRTQAHEMLEAIGGEKSTTFDNKLRPGLANHEMGTARMGRDAKTSVLNKWNQSHEIPNLFITDGACMTSSSCVNPSITYMALTARAVDYAVKELNRRNI